MKTRAGCAVFAGASRASNSATVSLTVTAANDTPVAADVAVNTAKDTSIAIKLIAAHADSARDSLQLVTTPPLVRQLGANHTGQRPELPSGLGSPSRQPRQLHAAVLGSAVLAAVVGNGHVRPKALGTESLGVNALGQHRVQYRLGAGQ